MSPVLTHFCPTRRSYVLKDDSCGFCPRDFIVKRQTRSGWIEPCFQRLPVRGHVLDRLLRHSALHRGPGHGGGNDLHQARIERRRDDIFRTEAVRATISARHRSEEHTSELQSLMRISYAVFCLKKKIRSQDTNNDVRLQKKQTLLRQPKNKN